MDPSSIHVGNESPPARTTILSSFLRGRPRGTSQSHIALPPPHLNRELSSSPPWSSNPPPPSMMTTSTENNHRRRPPAIQASVSANTNPNTAAAVSGGGLGITNMLRRRRSAGNVASSGTNGAPANQSLAPTPPPQPARSASDARSPTSGAAYRIRLVPHLDSRRSLRFEAIARELKDGDPALRIGRFTDRSGLGLAAVNALGSNKLAFKSKVVSRAHAEIWVEGGGRFMIKDTKSSSGTFLNHVRLSPANSESRPHQIKDGDILQLGVDYQGGTEDIYKSVKIRIEVGREWQAGANAFNTNALKNLKTLATTPIPTITAAGGIAAAIKIPSKSNIPDCVICLFSVTIRQALFIAPCSHTFHYKCIRPILESHYPAFSCPICRTYADLEEDVEVDVEVDIDLEPELETAESGGSGVDVNMNAPSPPARLVVPVESRRIDGDGEREAGAETEVEADPRTGGVTTRGRTRNGVGRTAVSDVMESGEEDAMDLGEDIAMGGGTILGHHPGPSAMAMDDEVGVALGGYEPSPTRPLPTRAESTEREGSAGNGLAGIEGEGSDVDSGDEAIGGKRKR